MAEIINRDDFPCCYVDSDIDSLNKQKNYKFFIWLSLGIMFLSTILSSIHKQNFLTEINYNRLNGCILFIAVLISAWLLFYQPQRKWYIGRAVAESIKTLTWRFIMKSEPFNGFLEDEMRDLFIQRCSDVVAEAMRYNKFMPIENCSHRDFITQKMKKIRELSVMDKKNVYAKERIEEQMKWYNTKSKKNKRYGFVYTILLGAMQLLAVLYLVFFSDKIVDMDITAILLFISVCCISILELNKFNDLAQSYSLTAFELNTIRNSFGGINNEYELNKFVEQAEQAISREHTMWLARRGT